MRRSPKRIRFTVHPFATPSWILFASNSFLVDYDPDLIREIADATHDADLSKLADNCLKAVQQSMAPCGLFYDLIQPELMTLYPELPMIAFSPNDVVGIAVLDWHATAPATARI
jgi:hypothetical protein